MKKAVCVLLLLVLLAGCSGKNRELEQGIALRTKILASPLCSFDADITADYGNKLHTFSMQCLADCRGTIRFTVTAPESISGIQGSVEGSKGTLRFDDVALDFPLLADNQVTPVSAPWLLIKTLRSGCITSAGAEKNLARLSIDDSYDDDALHLDIWLDENGLPIRGEILYRERKILSLIVKNFTIQ